MDITSDSDDSAFILSTSLHKRKIGCDVENNVKKLRWSSEDERIENVEEQNKTENFLNDLVHSNPSCHAKETNKLVSESHVLSSKEEKDVGMDKLSQKLENYFSCPLCLKILNSETAHSTHMKQCAKKSKMSAKQLLEALQLHKKHLKERISAGLMNIPVKKKKVQTQGKNTESTYELALALALSKSLEDNNISGKETHNFAAGVHADGNSETTLEKFGFTSSGRILTALGKKSKNKKTTRFLLRERTSEDREKLITEKASVILLINDETMVGEAKKSLRIYHCKQIEKTRNKSSYLWKTGELIEGIEWYIEDLKDFMIEEKVNQAERKDREDITHQECNIDDEIIKLNLPKTAIFEDWKRMVNNKHLSDLTLITKEGENVYLHSVVLYARFQKVLDSDLKIIFRKFGTNTILKFLQYLYCGTLDGLTRGELDNLLDLAHLVEYQDLADILSSLKLSLSDSTAKTSNDSGVNNSSEWQKEYSPELNNWHDGDYKTSNGCKEETSWNFITDLNETAFNETENIEGNENSVRKLCQEETVVYDIEDKGDVNEEESGTKRHGSPHGNDEERHHIQKVAVSEVDLFEEAENLNETIGRAENNNSNLKDDPECIEISSGSTKSGTTPRELPEMDYEIPYFDPFEHFNDDIPETEPFPSPEEQNIHSQSLIIGEISPVKSDTPKRNFCENESPLVSAPECCSTPVSQPSTSANEEFRKCSEGDVLRRSMYTTPCSKINRMSGKSKVVGSKSLEKRRNDLNEESEKLASALTESILREFDNSMGSGVRKTPQTEERNYVEVTPVVPGEEYSEDVSPLPDYSIMGATSIKKHLTKYGLKKSLSKNKAKKILRHIYEELHPIINTKNGKIVKYIQSEKPKKSKGKKAVTRAKKKSKEPRKTPTVKRSRKTTEVSWTEPVTPTKKKATTSWNSPKLTSPKCVGEDDSQSCTSMDSYDGTSGGGTLTDGCSYEVEEPLSQGNYSSATDAATAVRDFISNNKDVHRQILMYQPIWLEELQRNLFDIYNKKFKLTDLMDCLDAECITFRCESQKRTNKRRK